jgi:hypothetical protein
MTEEPHDELLESIASDPDAGPWAAWARKLLAGDQADQAQAEPSNTDESDWGRPRKSR